MARSRRRPDTVTELPGGALSTTFALQHPVPPEIQPQRRTTRSRGNADTNNQVPQAPATTTRSRRRAAVPGTSVFQVSVPLPAPSNSVATPSGPREQSGQPSVEHMTRNVQDPPRPQTTRLGRQLSTVEEEDPISREDDPFASGTPPAPPHVPTSSAPDSPGEYFDFPPDTGRSTPQTPPPHPAQEPQTPRRTPRHAPHPASPQTPGSARRFPVNRPRAISRAAYHGTTRSAPAAAPAPDRQRPETSNRQRSGTKRDRRSKDVWTFFKTIEGKSCCHFCMKNREAGEEVPVHEYGAGTSITGLRNHLIHHHLKTWVETCVELKIPIESRTGKDAVEAYANKFGEGVPGTGSATLDSDLPRKPLTKETLADAIMTFVVADDQSLNVIESPYFRNLILQLRADLKDTDIPHIDSLRLRVLETVDQYWDTLSAEMQTSEGSISFTSDLWTDQNQRSFMGITAHWIQAKMVQTTKGMERQLVLRCDLIGFYQVPGRHTGEHLAEAFLSAIDRLDIAKKIGWITLDNASNNDTFVTALARILRGRYPDLAWDPRKRRIRCFAHIVNLAVQALIKQLQLEGNGLITRIRELVRAIRSSGLRRKHFLECARQIIKKELQLILDSEIRWSSTYLMVHRTLILQQAMERFFTSEEFESLILTHWISPADWTLLKDMESILETPHLFQQCLSAEKTPTLCDAIPAFEAMIKKFDRQTTTFPALETAIHAATDKLEEYLGYIRDVPAYKLAMAVNPGLKLSYILAHHPEQYAAAKQLLIDAIRPYVGTDATTNVPAEEISWEDRILYGNSRTSARTAYSAEEEVEIYLAERLSSVPSLAYWQENCNRYPAIYRLAMDILPIQGTSVPCERIFSSAKETITARRSRLSAEMMEALQILKFAIKMRGGLDFTQYKSLEEQLADLEALTDSEFAVPTDVGAFASSLRTTESFAVS